MRIVLTLILNCIGYSTKLIILCFFFKILDENSMTNNVLNDHSYSTMHDSKSSKIIVHLYSKTILIILMSIYFHQPLLLNLKQQQNKKM